MRRRNWTVPYALFLIIFVVMPLLLIVVYAFTDAEGAFTFANFRKFMMHPESINTFVYSIGISVITLPNTCTGVAPRSWAASIRLFGTTVQENIYNGMWNYGAALSLIMLLLIGVTALFTNEDDSAQNESGGVI